MKKVSLDGGTHDFWFVDCANMNYITCQGYVEHSYITTTENHILVSKYGKY